MLACYQGWASPQQTHPQGSAGLCADNRWSFVRDSPWLARWRDDPLIQWKYRIECEVRSEFEPDTLELDEFSCCGEPTDGGAAVSLWPAAPSTPSKISFKILLKYSDQISISTPARTPLRLILHRTTRAYHRGSPFQIPYYFK